MHSMKLGFSVVAAAALAIVGAGRASADAVYNNGGPNQVDGFNISGVYRSADDFKVTSATVLGSVSFWDVEASGTQLNSLHWTIYADNAGVIGSPVLQGTTSSFTHVGTGKTLNTAPSLHEFHDAFALPNVVFNPGTYWLAIHADSSNGDLFWETTNPNTSATRAQQFNGTAWFSTGSELAFNVAPLPSALGGGAALIGLLGAARLFRRVSPHS
jgi:hypothetical protein